ncbi:hypothetical protein B0H67DRAFT_642493 [Lasiosphaeris hirsuta]|uniref:GPI inositol-deacylase winged helix domain-containing protein n=1 Tax=Lasiosphaeris hirsuta TaxID=260670 RepID=A0AA40ANI4_9PEZI|nr:hypothetical protein B0H67DRAFT_642493 [Lasiosphaeris hirsuta]
MDDLIDDFRAQPSLEYLESIVTKVFPAGRRILCLLDGLDECPENEGLQVLRCIRRLRAARLRFRCCVSVRSTAHEGLVTKQNLGEWATIHMPDDNPDIVSYINSEIQNRIETGQLRIRDPTLAIEIRDALLPLQMESLSEESDEAIRCAIEELPENLYATFERILTRAWKGKREYQGSVLKLVSAAHRPLTLEELREALSLTPNHLEWHRGCLVNDTRGTIRCCGSLIVVDEEELSVCLIHHSVRQFLLSGDHRGKKPRPWSFTAEEADMLMGEVVVTYLSYGVFETQISTTVVPTSMLAPELTDKIIEDALASAGVAGKLALMLLRGAAVVPAQTQQTSVVNLDRSIADAWGQYHQREVEVFHLLPYATCYWLPHTTWVGRGSRIYKLRLVVCNNPNPRFDMVPWPQSRLPADAGDLMSISNSHMALLSAELTGKRWARSFASVMPYLLSCRNRECPPVLGAHMATKLLPFAVIFGSAKIIKWLLSMGAEVPADDHCVLRLALSNRGYEILDALLTTADAKEGMKHVSRLPLLHSYADAGDVEGLKLLLNQKYYSFNVNMYLPGDAAFGNDNPIQAALKSRCSSLVELRRVVDTVLGLLDPGADVMVYRRGSGRCVGLLLRFSLATAAYLVELVRNEVNFSRPLARSIFSDIEASLERTVMRDKESRPEWLIQVMTTYLLVVMFPATFQDTPFIKEHYLKHFQVLLRHRHNLDCEKLLKDNLHSFTGVIRYILASYGVDVSAIPRENQISSDDSPLALRAARLGRDFIPVVRLILIDDLSIRGCFWGDEFERIVAMAKSEEEREILTSAFNLCGFEAAVSHGCNRSV